MRKFFLPDAGNIAGGIARAAPNLFLIVPDLLICLV
jgi:hypothetical protein